MRKSLLSIPTAEPATPETAWLNLEEVARVEVTSEAPDHPIEHALLSPEGGGWVASGPGEQIIRLTFDQPQRIQRVRLLFEEHAVGRVQQFVLRWSAAPGDSFREIVRQEFVFSPPGTVRELEDYRVDLHAVKALELAIVPEKSGGPSRASLAKLQLA